MRRNVTDVEAAGRLRAIAFWIEVIMNRDVRRCTGSCRIDADSGDEVIDCAGGGIDGNAGDRGPVNAVGGSAIYEIVGGAFGAEAAILPHDVDCARAIHGGGRQGAAANAAIIDVALNVRDGHGSGPG